MNDKLGAPEPVIAANQPASGRPVPRVAVIGVHGIGYHAAGATENAMSDLLLSLPAKNHSAPRAYDSFRSVGIQIPLQPLVVSPTPKVESKTPFGKMFSFLQEQSANFAALGTQYARSNPDRHVPRGAAAREFMRLLLEDYEGGADGDAYVTTRLEGNRLPGAYGNAAEVHIYEMLWADLARPTNSFLSFLFSLFQLVLHLGSLSRLAIDSGAAENSNWRWRVYCSVQRYAVRMLQIVIPLFKVILLISLLACASSVSAATHDKSGLPLAMGAVAGLAVSFLIGRKTQRVVTGSPLLWSLLAIFPAIVGVVLAWLILHFSWVTPNALSALECWVVLGVGLLFYVLDKYADIRRGVQYVGYFIFGCALLLFAAYLVVPSIKASSVPEASLWTAQWLLAALRVSWMFLWGFAVAAMVLGSLAWRSIPKPDSARRARARAAVRTSRFALGLPSLLFLLLTTLLWTGMFSIARAIHDPFFEAKYLHHAPGAGWLASYRLIPDPEATRVETEKTCDDFNPGCSMTGLTRIQPLPESAYLESSPAADEQGQLARVQPVPDSNPDNSKPDYLVAVLRWSVTNGFPLILISFGLSLFLLFWWVLPSVLTENFPLRDSEKPEPPRSSTNAESLRMGTWLSRGLDATSVITFLFWISIFVIPAIYITGFNSPSWLQSTTAYIVQSFITLTTAALLAALLKYGSVILDAILDVDTYLRASPQKATPRAQIVERYVSLLRYIARYRGPDGRGYDFIVIVAHSLGTLISADLLRFLKEVGDPQLASLGLAGPKVDHQGGISVRFLTMGSPIRQLLNRFFPYLYDWVRDEPDNSSSPLPKATLPPPPQIMPGAFPDPTELGVTEWVNVYRSGDYVGRSLWLDEWYYRTAKGPDHGRYPDPIHVAAQGPRREMCVGAGAHTHYWDDTAPDVAEQLNRLI
jgi:hypothetical protein